MYGFLKILEADPCIATYHPSQKLSKKDEVDGIGTAGVLMTFFYELLRMDILVLAG